MQPEPVLLGFVPIEEFVAVNEPGVAALLGGDGDVLIPEGGDVMVYGDGGVGKTTLTIDLAFHLAAGDDWCDIPIRRPVSCALVENEGPRPLFRQKLAHKWHAWEGAPIDGRRLHVLDSPWARFTFTDEQHRRWIAEEIAERGLDVVVLGPLTRLGMDEAGTLQHTRDFAALLADVRSLVDRPVTFLLVHHENKGGQVSGAWEGAGDTLLHVQGRGHGKTHLVVQKARWASSWHGKSLDLLWADGESFTVNDTPEIDDNAIAAAILAAVRTNPGCSWNTIEKSDSVRGKAARARAVRDHLLGDGQLVNGNAERPGKGMALHDAETAPRPLRLGSDTDGTHRDAPADAPASLNGAQATHNGSASLRPDTDAPGTHPPESVTASGASLRYRDAPTLDAHTDAPPITLDELERLAADHADLAQELA